MPIPVACQCGQQFAANDSLAGQNVKCPKCGGVISIPQLQQPQAAPSVTPTQVAPFGTTPPGDPASPEFPTGDPLATGNPAMNQQPGLGNQQLGAPTQWPQPGGSAQGNAFGPATTAPASSRRWLFIAAAAGGGGVLLISITIALVMLLGSDTADEAILGQYRTGQVTRPTRPGRVVDERTSLHNLYLIGIATHHFCDKDDRLLPTAYSTDESGKPLLSWRVHLLPYIGMRYSSELQKEHQQLYDEFRLDEPWNSEHNSKLIPRMPDVYKVASNYARVGQTHYMLPRGDDTMWRDKEAITFGGIPDGSRSTVYFVEASHERSVVWTQPEDFEFDPQNPKAGLIGVRDGGFMCVGGDARAYKLSGDMPNEALLALFVLDDSERGVQINPQRFEIVGYPNQPVVGGN